MLPNTLKRLGSFTVLLLAVSFLTSSASSCNNQDADHGTIEQKAGDAEVSEHPKGESDEHPSNDKQASDDEHPSNEEHPSSDEHPSNDEHPSDGEHPSGDEHPSNGDGDEHPN